MTLLAEGVPSSRKLEGPPRGLGRCLLISVAAGRRAMLPAPPALALFLRASHSSVLRPRPRMPPRARPGIPWTPTMPPVA